MKHVKFWSHVSSHKCSICTKSLFLSNFGHKFIYIPVSEPFSFAKIIHPPDRCGIARNSMIITQVHLVLGTIKGHFKMCSFVTVPLISSAFESLQGDDDLLKVGLPTIWFGYGKETNENIF